MVEFVVDEDGSDTVDEPYAAGGSTSGVNSAEVLECGGAGKPELERRPLPGK